MSKQAYATSMVTVVLGVFFSPGLTELLQVYVITVVVFVTIVINLLFRIQTLRQWIVERLTADVLQEIFKDKDVLKLLEWSKRRDASRRKILERLEEKKAGEHSAK